MITSLSNARIKYVKDLMEKSKLRRNDRCFAAEGVKMFLEAPLLRIRQVYVMESFLETKGKCSGAFGEKYSEIKDKLDKVNYEAVADNVFKKMCDTITPQGIITVVDFAGNSIDDIINVDKPLIMILENVQDPGNIGTIIRTAEGAGASGVILTADCADIYSPKVIRATMGSIYRVPVYITQDLEDTLQVLSQKDIVTVAAALNKSSVSYDLYDYALGTAFLIGNEGNGLRQDTINTAKYVCYIPMLGEVESLNASVAASILMYEAAKQRRNQL